MIKHGVVKTDHGCQHLRSVDVSWRKKGWRKRERSGGIGGGGEGWRGKGEGGGRGRRERGGVHGESKYVKCIDIITIFLFFI